MICANCDKFKLYGKECYHFFEEKNWCTKREINGEEKPIYPKKWVYLPALGQL